MPITPSVFVTTLPKKIGATEEDTAILPSTEVPLMNLTVTQMTQA